jgi:Secretion system C-terminal sorting domain
LLDSGSYYIGITQPANFGSDSIYYGFDVNTNSSAQHLHFDVLGSWQTSNVNGSVMLRPIVGQSFTPSVIQHFTKPRIDMRIFPNPSKNTFFVESDVTFTEYILYDLHGHIAMQGKLLQNQISLQNLSNGFYFLQCKNQQFESTIQRIIKQD